MLFSLAWRNIWRNKRRSLIIITAITVGLLCGLFASAVMFGMADSMVSSTINRDLGHIQIHSKQFEEEKLLIDTLPNFQNMINDIVKLEHITGVSSRIVIEGMGSSAASSNGLKIVGIDPDRERSVTNINQQLIAGNYFVNENNEQSRRFNQIIIGEKLAQNLSLRERSKIILSFQDFDGSIMYGAFRVTGIFKTESAAFDKSTVFVRESDLLSLLNSEPFYHEIVLKLSTVKNVDTVYSKIAGDYPEVSVKSWKELAPELKLMDEMTGVQLNIFVGIILFALLFGITNTMLMSVIERVREFGVLMAIGMKRIRLFMMIILETIYLSIVGGIMGMVFASVLIAYFGRTGIDLSSFSEGFNEWSMSPVLQPALPVIFYFSITIMILLTAILSAVYPAVKAVKLNPAKAIRTY